MDDNTKFKILIQRWKDPKFVGDPNKLNKLTEETIRLVNNNPFIRDICEIFMYAVSFKAMNESDMGNVAKGDTATGNISKGKV